MKANAALGIKYYSEQKSPDASVRASDVCTPSQIENGTALDDAVYGLHTLRNTTQTDHCIPFVVAVA